MKAMRLERLGTIERDSTPLTAVEVDTPEPGADEVLLRVRTCGVCHTELDEIEGRLPPPLLPVIPGHQVVGEVVSAPCDASVQPGDRVGVGWIHRSDGSKHENIASEFVATGCDVDGGYAEYMTVPAAYTIPVPPALGDEECAPLLCAGAIGYRALKLAGLADGDALGLAGFGGSAHLVLQLVRVLYPNSPVFVFARSSSTRAFAAELGADWSGAHTDTPPQPLQAIIDTTPAWQPVVAALGCLRPGGRLVINAIRKESGDQDALLELSYHEHLWLEREVKSVANITRADIAELLPIAAENFIHARVDLFNLDDANRALTALKFDTTLGAKVLRVTGD